MTEQEKIKYAYECMVKNNPDEAIKQLLLKDKIIEKTQQSYTDEYNLRHKLSFELSEKDDKILELSNHLTSYSSEETMLKEINDLQQRINKAIEYINDDLKDYQTISSGSANDLLKIIRGEDNE